MVDQPHATVVFDRQDLLTECLVEALRRLDGSIEFLIETNLEAFLDRHDGSTEVVLVICPRWSERAFDEQLARLEGVAKHPKAGKIALLAEGEQVSIVLQSLRAGATGYIPTSLPLKVVLEGLRLIVVGSVFIPSSCLLTLSARSARFEAPRRVQIETLNERELLIAEALRVGTSNKAISAKLNICESTVKLLVRGIMRKLNARNRTEVAYLMIEANL